MTKVLVTGATGFIGANLTRVLLDNNHSVKVLVRPTSDYGNLTGLDIEVETGDLRDFNSLLNATKDCDTVYHVAAEYNFWSQNPDVVYQSNVDGTKNLLEACKQNNVSKVVYTSTVGTIGLSENPKPCNENTPLVSDQMTGHYKTSKFEAEKIALDYAKKGLPVVIVNPSAPVGSFDRKPTPTGKIILDFLKGKLPAYLNTGLNIAHVRDVALGHILAAQNGRVGERYILGNQNMSLAEILNLLSKITGRPAPWMKIPYSVAWIAGMTSTKISDWVTHKPPAVPIEAVKMAKRYMYFDSSKAVKELGLPQSNIQSAFEDAVEWFLSQKKNYNISERVIYNGYSS